MMKVANLRKSVTVELLSLREYLAELCRPWKLFSLAVGMAWLLYGAYNYGISDWDVGISLIMGGLTYLCAPRSVRIILYHLQYRPRFWVLWIISALLVAWFVVDGVYVFYHTAMGNQMLRIENFYASSALYFLAGAIWLYSGSLRDLVSNLRALFRNQPGVGQSMSRRKIVSRILVIILLGVFSYIAWPFIVGGSRMESFCNSLTNGLSFKEVEKLATPKGYRMTRLSNDQQSLVHEPRSMGRFLCVLKFRDDRLISAKYENND